MGTGAVLLQYQERLVALHATTSQLRIGQMIALAIALAALVAILILGYFSFVKRTVPLPFTLIPVAFFIYSARLYKSRNSDLHKTLRRRIYYENGVDRLHGGHIGAATSGVEFVPHDHYYAKDLDVFGDGSLFQLLCTCRTQVGCRSLAGYLLEAAPLPEISSRQEAVKELTTNIALREEIALLGKYQFEGASWNNITEWLAAAVSPTPMWLRMTALLACSALACLVLLGWDRAIEWSILLPWIGVLLAASGLTGYVYRARVSKSSRAIRSVLSDVSILRQGLQLMQTQVFASPLLAELVEKSRQGDPSKNLGRLEKLLAAFVERDKECCYFVSRMLLIGTQLFWAIQKWRLEHDDRFSNWVSTWGEFEALVALSNYAYEHPENTHPELSSEKAVLEATGIGHPLLAAGCVRNDVALNSKTRFYIISGSNMAGKSTMLRTIGLNAVLAYAGAPVCATSLRLSRFQICAAIGVQDSPPDGKSRFLAEIDRLRLALGVPEERGAVLFLIDELLSGTNSTDRRLAAEVILRELIRRGAVGALSTHDLALTGIALLEGMQGENVHMASSNETDPLDFDYLLKPGLTQQSQRFGYCEIGRAGFAPRMNFKYPIFLDLKGKKCIVTGEGYEVGFKVKNLVEASATVTYINPSAEPSIEALATAGLLHWEQRAFQEADLEGCFLVLTDLEDNSHIFRLCEERRILCNSVDDPENCRFSFGSLHRQGDLTIAISTNGWAPAVAVRLKEWLQREIGPEYATLLAMLKEVRPEITSGIADFATRKDLWYRIVDSQVIVKLRNGDEAGARDVLREMIKEARVD